MDLKGLQPHRCHQGYSDQDFLPQNMELQSFPGHFLLALFSETDEPFCLKLKKKKNKTASVWQKYPGWKMSFENIASCDNGPC